MAVREYIGARYVPLYVGDWDSTKNYEPLTIVTDANGNSFTSIRDVPAGTPLSDRTYWIQTSSFSGAVEVLSRRVSDVENNVETIDGNITAITDRIDGLEESITGFDDKINTVDDRVDSILLDNKKLVCIADSYGMRSTPNWCSLFESRFDAVTHAQSGTGFLTNPGFLTQLQSVVSGMSEDDKKSVTDVIVCGGWNDARELARGSTLQDLQNAIIAFCEYSRANLINAEIHVGFIAWQTAYNGQPEVTFDNLRGACDIYEKSIFPHLHNICAGKFPMRCTLLMDDTYFHPNNGLGAAYLFYSIANQVFGYGYSFEFFGKITAGQLMRLCQTIGNPELSYAFENDNFIMKSNAFTFTATSSSATHAFDILEIPRARIPFATQAVSGVQYFTDQCLASTVSVNGASQTVNISVTAVLQPTNTGLKLRILIPGTATSLSGTLRFTYTTNLNNLL